MRPTTTKALQVLVLSTVVRTTSSSYCSTRRYSVRVQVQYLNVNKRADVAAKEEFCCVVRGWVFRVIQIHALLVRPGSMARRRHFLCKQL
jgi:hypothetical protein